MGQSICFSRLCSFSVTLVLYLLTTCLYRLLLKSIYAFIWSGLSFPSLNPFTLPGTFYAFWQRSCCSDAAVPHFVSHQRKLNDNRILYYWDLCPINIPCMYQRHAIIWFSMLLNHNLYSWFFLFWVKYITVWFHWERKKQVILCVLKKTYCM